MIPKAVLRITSISLLIVLVGLKPRVDYTDCGNTAQKSIGPMICFSTNVNLEHAILKLWVVDDRHDVPFIQLGCGNDLIIPSVVR